MVKISVIVPVYNSEEYLRKCLDSTLKQTLKDMEIIIINDGSTDKSQEIIDEYVCKYNDKIRSLNQKNSGQAAARNRGIKEATGEYVAFLDSDDYLELNAYELAYKCAEDNRLDIVCFDFFEVVNGEKGKSNYYLMESDKTDIKYILNETSPCNKIIRTKVLKENELTFFENHIYEDLALIPTLLLYTKKIGFINKPLYNYVIRQKSTMRQSNFNNKLLDIYEVMETLYNKFSNTEYKSELEYLYIEHLLHGASIRFLGYKEGIKELDNIVRVINQKFCRWKNNIYYKKKNIKYKIICDLIYHKKYRLVKNILNIKNV